MFCAGPRQKPTLSHGEGCVYHIAGYSCAADGAAEYDGLGGESAGGERHAGLKGVLVGKRGNDGILEPQTRSLLPLAGLLTRGLLLVLQGFDFGHRGEHFVGV
jgi:hypothetical protein